MLAQAIVWRYRAFFIPCKQLQYLAYKGHIHSILLLLKTNATIQVHGNRYCQESKLKQHKCIENLNCKETTTNQTLYIWEMQKLKYQGSQYKHILNKEKRYLICYWCTSIRNHNSDTSLICKLPCFFMDLRHHLSQGNQQKFKRRSTNISTD